MPLTCHESAPFAAWRAAKQAMDAHCAAAMRAYCALLRFHARTARLRSGTLRELGLTHARLRIIAVVAASPNLSISQIARELDLSRQAVHRVVHEMERGNAVEISKTHADRRTCSVSLTALGQHIATLAVPWEGEWTSYILDNADAEDLSGIAAISDHVRSKLPWTIQGPDDSERCFNLASRAWTWLRRVAPGADEYAIRAAVSLTPR
jgi:DNA-binding MarR family transcriptional regulator